MGHSPTRRLRRAWFRREAIALSVCAPLAAGCTTLDQWIHNGFKVGPNYQDPPAPLATEWIDSADARISHDPADDGAWWSIFKDPALNQLIESAYKENLDLKTAAVHVLELRAQRNIAAGNLLPQSQNAVGDYTHVQIGSNFNPISSPIAAFPTNLNVWATGFNAAWELDFWGRLRRQIESANADVDASIESYRSALVTLTADTATNYVQLRTFQQRIAFAQRNLDIQKGSLRLAEARMREGTGNALDVEQAKSNLAQTESSIPPLALGLREANNRLCILLGKPTENLLTNLTSAPIPSAPLQVAVGIPADLLERRPDVRHALQQVASQCAQIGVAEAELYPRIGVSGFIGYAANDFSHLFAEDSFTAYVLPNFQWKILNYGRLTNNIRTQDARLQQRIFEYQQKVLMAGQEVENALAGFIQYQVQARNLEESVKAAENSVDLVLALYKQGRVDFNRVFTTQSFLVTQLDQLAVARGNIALSVISIYRALGGGWRVFEDQPSRDGTDSGVPGN